MGFKALNFIYRFEKSFMKYFQANFPEAYERETFYFGISLEYRVHVYHRNLKDIFGWLIKIKGRKINQNNFCNFC